jgi:hypothetical protein
VLAKSPRSKSRAVGSIVPAPRKKREERGTHSVVVPTIERTGHPPRGPFFIRHFLPTITGYEAKEEIDINDQLQKYFEFAANAWVSFASGDYKQKFPRDFRFTVTVPHTFIGELPPELVGEVKQLEVHIVAQDPPTQATTMTGTDKGENVK